MGRIAKEPRYYATKGGYFTVINSERILLAKGKQNDPKVKERARKNFHALMAVKATKTEGDENYFYAVANAYLHWVKAYKRANTYLKCNKALQSFINKFSTLLIKDLREHHVQEWLLEKKTWGPSSRQIAIAVMKGCLNWASKKNVKLISENPLQDLEIPKSLSRSSEALISKEQHEALLKYQYRRKHKGFYYYLIALWETGARPGEVAGMTAANYRPDRGPCGAWVIEPREALTREGYKMGSEGVRRVIYFTPKLREIVESLNRQHPEGFIFRNEDGSKFLCNTISHKILTMKKSIDRKRVAASLPPLFNYYVTPYSYRHRFATEMITAGEPMAYVASLMGTSVQMLDKHYSHLEVKADSLGNRLVEFHLKSAPVSLPHEVEREEDFPLFAILRMPRKVS